MRYCKILDKLQIKSEIHDVTRQFFTRHKNEFKNWGDAIHWLHTVEHKIVKQEAGSHGQSNLSTEILWLVSLFGPTKSIDWDIVHIRKVPSLSRIPKKEAGSTTEPIAVMQTPHRRRLRRKRY